MLSTGQYCSQMPQDVGYRIAKAVLKGWPEVNEAYPPTRGLHPIEDALKHTPNVKGVYFHAGVVQLARELKIDVPAHLIPPEYKDAK